MQLKSIQKCQSHSEFMIRPLSRVQAQIAGVAVGNTGAEPFVGDTDPDRSVARVVFYPEPVEAAAEA